MRMVLRSRARSRRGLRGSLRRLRSLRGSLPVLPRVLVEHLATEVQILRAPFRRQPALGHGHFEEPQLRLDVLLAVALQRAGLDTSDA